MVVWEATIVMQELSHNYGYIFTRLVLFDSVELLLSCPYQTLSEDQVSIHIVLVSRTNCYHLSSHKRRKLYRNSWWAHDSEMAQEQYFVRHVESISNH